MKISLAILISGTGRTLRYLSENYPIDLVISSKHTIGYEYALENKIPSLITKDSEEIIRICDKMNIDLILLCGYIKKIHVPEHWKNRIMNIHPSLLPEFGGKGFYGLNVHKAVIEAGKKISGCTVHFVNNEYDKGPIIIQRTCPVLENDTPETLAQRVFEEEKIAYVEAIDKVSRNMIH